MVTLAEVDAQERQKLLDSTLAKAESALVAGHYITPPGENVVLHCNRGLIIDPENQKFRTMKKEAVNRVVEQASSGIQLLKFDEARSLYTSMDYISQSDSEFPVPRKWIQDQLRRVDFSDYPVIHEHKFGGCNGRLRLNAYVLSYVPSADTGHGFVEPLSRVTITELGDTLKIKLDGGFYRFQTNSGAGPQQNREILLSLYQRLIGLMTAAH